MCQRTMDMIKRVYRFIRYNKLKKMSFLALLYSAVFRLEILLIKPAVLHKRWGVEGQESPEDDSLEHYKYAKAVAFAVDHICTRTAWESKCLVRALTAQRLLKKKNIHTTLYLGCGTRDGKMIAHSWLRCGKLYVTGGNGNGYATVSKFYV